MLAIPLFVGWFFTLYVWYLTGSFLQAHQRSPLWLALPVIPSLYLGYLPFSWPCRFICFDHILYVGFFGLLSAVGSYLYYLALKQHFNPQPAAEAEQEEVSEEE